MSETIGVLALQGAYAEHIAALSRLGVATVEVRAAADLDLIDGTGHNCVISTLTRCL